jgi:hypothetical protein
VRSGGLLRVKDGAVWRRGKASEGLVGWQEEGVGKEVGVVDVEKCEEVVLVA